MIRNQVRSAGICVSSMRSVTSWLRQRVASPKHSYHAALLLFMLLYVLIPTVAAQEPQRDPAGTATGDRQHAIDAGGNSFVVAEPTDKAAPDYAVKKKGYDEYQTQVAREPLAVKLADAVGHTRIGTNFSWTLLTGYLVLFMQAGFALLTCGLVRKKNTAHLMMLTFAA